MSLLVALSTLACLLAALAIWAGLRRAPADPGPFEALRRSIEDLASRDRVESQQALVSQLRPLLAELGELKTAQAEKLAEGFRLLAAATQEALRTARAEQAGQLNQVQQQVEQRLEAIQKSNEERL